MGIDVVVVAAGAGTRMAAAEKKTFLKLNDVPILIRSLKAFELVDAIGQVVVVAAEIDRSRVQKMTEAYRLTKVKHVVGGGAQRQDSVRAGIEAVTGEWVLIHDGARPFVLREDITRLIAALGEKVPAATLAVPVKDTIKRVDRSGRVLETPERDSLWAVQTPQAFRLDLLKEAHRCARQQGWSGTDDAGLMERMGYPVQIVMGNYCNIKITTPEDLIVAAGILQSGGYI